MKKYILIMSTFDTPLPAGFMDERFDQLYQATRHHLIKHLFNLKPESFRHYHSIIVKCCLLSGELFCDPRHQALEWLHIGLNRGIF